MNRHHQDQMPRPLGKIQWFALPGVILAVTLAAYAPALQCGFIWDDDAYLTHNQTLRTVDGLRRIWFEFDALPQYYPLVHTTYWIEYHLWGRYAPGYHLTNILLHAASAVLLWRLLTKLSIPGAYLAALLFALHPVHVESVAWVTERKNVLSGLFYLSAALAFLRFEMIDQLALTKRQFRWYLLFLVFFVCALLSKTVTVTLPAALLLVLWWKRGMLSRRDVVLQAPMFLIGIPLALVTVWMETHHVGTKMVEGAFDLTLIDRCLIAGRALCFYAGKLFWPHPLTFIYPRWHVDASVWWQYSFPLVFFGVVAVLWRSRQRLGTGPLTAILFFAGTLTPALGFVNVYPMQFSFVADHFQYLASIGLIALAAAFVTETSKPWQQRYGWLARLGVVPVLCVLGLLTFTQCYIYTDLETLWSDTVKKNPRSTLALVNLGNVYFFKGDNRKATDLYQAALQIDPQDDFAYCNLGLIHERQNQMDQAIRCFEKSLEINPLHETANIGYGSVLNKLGRSDEAIDYFAAALRANSKSVLAHRKMGDALYEKGRLEEAEQHYLDALEGDFHDEITHVNLAIVLLDSGRIGQAFRHLQRAIAVNPSNEAARYLKRAIEINPRNQAMHVDLGNLLMSQNRLDSAKRHYQQAIEVNPNQIEAHINLGIILVRQNDFDAALVQFQKTVQMAPRHPLARNNLAKFLHDQGRLKEAIVHYRKAIELAPASAISHNNLGVALLDDGQRDEAIHHFRESLRLQPSYLEAKHNLDRALNAQQG